MTSHTIRSSRVQPACARAAVPDAPCSGGARGTRWWLHGLLATAALAAGPQAFAQSTPPASASATAAASAASPAGAAPVAASAAWARATVQGQRSTGAFMTLVAREPLTLVGVASPVGAAEIHEMRLDGDVMRMRAIDKLELPAGQPVQLRPGGHHLMLMDLKAQLQPGASVPVTLTFRTARGEQRQLALQVPVSANAPAGAAAGAGAHGAHGGHGHRGHGHGSR